MQLVDRGNLNKYMATKVRVGAGGTANAAPRCLFLRDDAHVLFKRWFLQERFQGGGDFEVIRPFERLAWPVPRTEQLRPKYPGMAWCEACRPIVVPAP